MSENEVIIVNGIPSHVYDSLVDEGVRYAVISLPFTVDRIELKNIKHRVLNIAKGKIAEGLFQYFCSQNNINPDFSTCSTPFWTIDKRDFLLGNDEWDIKNNFVYHAKDTLKSYTQLPALVPNKKATDQWSKRNKMAFDHTAQVKFLFTYLKNADLSGNKRGKEFLEINLTMAQEILLQELYLNAQANESLLTCEPYTEEWFWSQMKAKGIRQHYTLNFRPQLIITGYADNSTFPLFKDTGKFSALNYQNYTQPLWYQRAYTTGSINFLKGTIWTTITNATCPVAELPSFYSLYPHLKNGMNCAVTN
jgi:hypothetical protein